MAAKLIPSGSLAGWAGVPAPVLLAHATIGAATTNDVVVGDIGAYTLFDIDTAYAIALIHLWTQCEEAFTASVTIDIGDSDTAALLISDTTINPAATGAALIADTGISTLPLVRAAGSADILATVGTATVAAGLLHVYLMYAVLDD